MAVNIKILDKADPRLDRHVEHDDRSWGYQVTEEVPKTPEDVFWPDRGPILNQKDLGGCVGFTGADFLNTDMAAAVRTAHNSGQFYDDQAGINFYHLATVSDSIKGTYPPDDTGSSGLGLAKALKKAGLITGYQHAFSWAQFQAAIAIQPVAVGTLWTNSMFNPNKDGVLKVGSLDDSNVAGGHEYMIRGISYTKSLVLMRNHWDVTWDTKDGEKIAAAGKVPGEAWITFADFQKLLANQGDVTVLKVA